MKVRHGEPEFATKARTETRGWNKGKPVDK
jgi:hypothetical protein